MSGQLTIQFLGAAENVTGSRYLLQSGTNRFLVDCGLYQERPFLSRNWEPFSVPPNSLDGILLTHAHLDHCGFIPRLVQNGFKGTIMCSPATADIARIVLKDCAKVMAEDAAFKRKRHLREGRQGPYPELPLYTADDVAAALPLFAPVPYQQAVPIGRDITATFYDAGHILGACMIRLLANSNGTARCVLFSGDVGRWNAPILQDPTLFEEADYVVIESTYGNKQHKSEESIPAMLAEIVNAAVDRGGNIIIPSFAVERAQEVLYHLNTLFTQKQIPPLRVFVDSPMAISVTEVFQRHAELFDEETRALLHRGIRPWDFPGLTLCRSVEESKAIKDYPESAIIIAGSGMCTAGRIKHHLVNNISDSRNTVLFVGYQANGTLGRLILEGAKEVRIHGQNRVVRAQVTKINGFSGHADRGELTKWLTALKRPPRKVFVTHGEPEVAQAFADHIRTVTGWQVFMAKFGETVALD